MKTSMKDLIPRLLLFVCFGMGFAFGHDCITPFAHDKDPMRSVVFDDFLLKGDNALNSLAEKIDQLDTADCFEFKLRNGKHGFGKLYKGPGFGLSNFRYGIGNEKGTLSFETMARVDEYLIVLEKMDGRTAETPGIGEVAGGAVAGILIALGLGYLFVYMMSGAIMAGGK